jgi:subtilisin
MVSGRRLLSLLVFCSLVCLAGSALAGPVAGQPAAPTTPIDSEPDDTDTEADRTVPSEQVPFGIRTTYGDDDLDQPAGGSGVAVAVVDTGVDRTHPDLENRVTLCRDFTGETVRRDSCTDDNGHGTHVAGTVAADGGDDGRGIYGVAPGAEIYAFKACDADGRCDTDSLAEAVRTAVDEGADVVVLSLGGRAEPRIQAATEYATDSGTVVVAASGNSGPDTGSILYPAAHPNVLAVGAVGPREEETVAPDGYRTPAFSSRGVDEPFDAETEGALEVAAVGVDVLSPLPDGGYGVKTGTSMAAPHVAGLVAKVIAASPSDPSVAAVRAELRDRATRYDVTAGGGAREGYDPASGFGIPTVSDPRVSVSISPPVPVSGEPFTLDGTPSRADARIVAYEWDTTNDGDTDRTGERIDLEKPPGTHRIRLRVTDAENASATASADVFVNDRPRVTVTVPEVRPGENATLSASVDNEYGATTVRWLLPDGSTATGGTVTHRFDSGTSTVEVTVTDAFGAASNETVTVTAEPAEQPVSASPAEQGPAFPSSIAALLALSVAAVVLWRRR